MKELFIQTEKNSYMVQHNEIIIIMIITVPDGVGVIKKNLFLISCSGFTSIDVNDVSRKDLAILWLNILLKMAHILE